MKKVVIFDFDGTLANSFPWFIKRINHIAKVLRFNLVKSEDIEDLRRMKVDEILKYLGISSFKLPFVILYMKWLIGKESQHINLFTEVPSLFEVLEENNIDIVILSSNSEKNVRLILKETTRNVSAFYCGAGLKTKENHFRKVKKDFSQAYLLSVGDELRDSIAAREVGIDHLNVTWGYARAEVFSGEEVIETFTSLESRILGYFDEKGRSFS